MNQLSPERLAYIAGLFDGEGCFCLSKKRSTRSRRGFVYVPTATMAMTAISFLEELATEMDVGYLTYLQLRNTNAKPQVAFHIRTRDLPDFINALLPYLRLKKRQAELILESCMLMPRGRTPDGEWAKKWNRLDVIHTELAQLNSRGRAND